MSKVQKHNFNYYNKLSDGKLTFYVILNFFVGLLDGIGLAMFIPLLYLATGTDGGESLGKLEVILDFFAYLNIPLSLFSILGLMVAVFFLKGILSYVRSIFYVKIQQSTARKIRFNLIRGLRSLSYQGFTNLDAGVVQNNMTTETARMIQAIIIYMSSVQNLIMMLVYVLLAFLANWQFAILVAIGGFVSNFIYKFFNTITKKNAQRLSNIGRNFQSYLIQSLHNFKYLKATNYFEKYNEKLKKEIIDSENTQFKIGTISAISDNLREPLIILIISVVILFQIKVMNGAVGSMMAALLLFYRSLTHLAAFQSFWNKYLANLPGVDSVENMLSEFKSFKDAEGNGEKITFGDIKISNLDFKYDERIVLEGVNLEIKRNTSVAFVGESGAGKTTIANIICGLILPEKGSFFVNDNDITNIDINEYRSKIGYVTQEAVIFDDTLFNNVSFWDNKNEQTLTRFWKAIEMAYLYDFANQYDEKEDVHLGNNGILISGGQKQRISIARELYKNIDLMIMDEATSALDSETEKFIKDQIDSLHGKFTVIVIAHRLSTIRNVDKIYLMESGKITASGSYKELYENSEKFKYMVELQNVSYV